MSDSASEPGSVISAGDRRQELLDGVLTAVKTCQQRFGQRAELATDSCPEVGVLCVKLEMAILHGLKTTGTSNLGMAVFRNVKELVSNGFGSSDTAGGIWRIVRTVLNRHEYERFSGLKNVTSDSGRGRAWLRSALNEQSLEKYVYVLLGDNIRLREFYEDWAFMRDPERASLLASIASSLCSIRFALRIDSPEVNGPEAPSIGASLSNLIPASLRPPTEDGTLDIEALPQPSVATEAQAAEIVIETSRVRKKKKRVRSNVAPIIESKEPSSNQDTSVSSVTLSSPFLAKQTQDTEKLTEKLNSLLKTPDPDKSSQSNSGADGDNVEFDHNPVDLGHVTGGVYDEANTTLSDVEVLNNSPESKPTRSSPLTPVANKDIGCLFPVQTSRTFLMSEGQNGSGDESLSNKSMDDIDYAAPVPVQAASVGAETGVSADIGSSLKQNELKQALLSVMQKKDDLEEQVKTAKKLLDQEVNQVAKINQELNDLKQIHREKLEKIEAKNAILSRENELLKHQLKKYVGAVQKLRDGPHAYETLAKLEGASQEQSTKYIDYHYEASEYEKKLIQVAEMHGELLEFSENLQRSLQTKEVTISRLRAELILLRGPLPEDEDRATDDSASLCSSFTESGSLGGSTRVLVNIWIPSVFLTGTGSSRHHVYQVCDDISVMSFTARLFRFI